MSKTTVMDTPNYHIVVDNEQGVGWFEHNILGDESGGGLWFEEGLFTKKWVLVDYDGVYELPREVRQVLFDNGYRLGDL